MIYKAIGIMSGSSLDGLDVAYAHFQETGGKWSYDILHADCYSYSREWVTQLGHATSLPAKEYQLLHTAYGHYIGEQVNRFIDQYALHHKVDLVSSHGHTTFHVPAKRMTAQLGDGAAIAAETGLPVISDLRAMDIAFGGQGAPIVPIGEKLLLGEFDFLLNLGGIANVSAKTSGGYIAFDICAANRVLNMLANQAGHEYDHNGDLAASGKSSEVLLNELNSLEYYSLPHPKSLANDFGTEEVFPLIQQHALSTEDALRTYVEHICMQVLASVSTILESNSSRYPASDNHRVLVTGGGALNGFLIKRLQHLLDGLQIETVIPEKNIINYKEALIMALMGVLRWREEYNTLASVTGARQNAIGGAVWLGVEA